ncbi:DNA dC-_dU-editing enzyme APOBEC-3C-like [Otolemur garnettii]|uniref:DNA dC->dU-editing enzyme APOBEC-3C-like n=1 Tax=Otolemur garnettii TaxID=30611 RepID=UPI000C7F0F0C|nr:DNA dC->dU-editing enzyme APOBEC-3C-like [Otolemur garnettii]
MKPYCPRQRGGQGQGYRMIPQIRGPMERMYLKTFYYHFDNRPYLSRRNDTWLCFEVKTTSSNSPGSYSGVFRNQGPRSCPWHTELCFLTWVRPLLSHHDCYQITWYMSWSPCDNCAGQVASFLATHENVSLTIYTARIYYFWKQDHRQGLLRMIEEGTQVYIMSSKEFQHCWENFVDHWGTCWVTRWNRLKKNYEFLVTKLNEILSDPMKRITPNTFYNQFHNRTGQKDTWLCFEVKEKENSNSSGSCPRRGVFRNQVFSKTTSHAEVGFLTWFQKEMPPNHHYEVTWYTSWSPCARCAWHVVNFLTSNPKVSLTIFAARLYYIYRPEIQQGLRRLFQEGARV